MMHVISSIIVYIHRSFVFNCYTFTGAVNCRVGQSQKFQFFIPTNKSASCFSSRHFRRYNQPKGCLKWAPCKICLTFPSCSLFNTIFGKCRRCNVVSVFLFGRSKSHFLIRENSHFCQRVGLQNFVTDNPFFLGKPMFQNIAIVNDICIKHPFGKQKCPRIDKRPVLNTCS